MEVAIIIKGFIVGAFMLVPGVSGGTMCMIFGIFDKLVESISRFFKQPKKSILFLAQFVIGAGAAFLLLSKLVTIINKSFQKEVAFFVIGAIIAGIPVIYKEAKVTKINFKVIFSCIVGLLLVYLFTRMPKNVFTVDSMSATQVIIQIIAGVLGALGLVLPGISFSAMLYMMGVYNFIYGNIGDRNFTALIPFAIGMVLGVLLLTSVLEYFMKNHPTPTYMIIIGFVIGSIWDIVKEMGGAPSGIQWVYCILTFIVGFVVINMLGKIEKLGGTKE